MQVENMAEQYDFSFISFPFISFRLFKQNSPAVRDLITGE